MICDDVFFQPSAIGYAQTAPTPSRRGVCHPWPGSTDAGTCRRFFRPASANLVFTTSPCASSIPRHCPPEPICTLIRKYWRAYCGSWASVRFVFEFPGGTVPPKSQAKSRVATSEVGFGLHRRRRMRPREAQAPTASVDLKPCPRPRR